MTKTHLIADESLGGVLREYIEVYRKAKVGDYAVQTSRWMGNRGNIAEITRVCDDGSGVTLGGHPLTHGEYLTLEPTDIVHVWITVGDLKGLVRYRLVDRKAEVGEKVLVYGHGASYVDGVRTVKRTAQDGHIFFDRGGRRSGGYYVLIPVNSEPAEPTPDIHDILANLAARVHDLESQLRDTQGNVERQGVEIETVKHLAKSNEEDIRLLDERTQPKINELTLTSRIDGTTKIDAKYSGIPTSEVLAKILDGGWGR
ncbi:hypothetical protein [Mesobacillus zeae]|uniref:Uncharacterized protein n=1 Tax=Mesobacillus zeae TaxID=1917180 RepID=A0A398BF26_9BACI|nr:hypothetical protein [Mesobacillus zeae]RID88969.1 hypothetical protein D1970_00260 [Mesobacillus zeae]